MAGPFEASAWALSRPELHVIPSADISMGVGVAADAALVVVAIVVIARAARFNAILAPVVVGGLLRRGVMVVAHAAPLALDDDKITFLGKTYLSQVSSVAHGGPHQKTSVQWGFVGRTSRRGAELPPR